ncbi:MAG: prenyltransferase/squalene oxidase repeat-containing protein [Planctomycetota bacterium]
MTKLLLTIMVVSLGMALGMQVAAQTPASETKKAAFAESAEACIKDIQKRGRLSDKASAKRDELSRKIDAWCEAPASLDALRTWGTKAGDYRVLFLQERRKRCYYAVGFFGEGEPARTRFAFELTTLKGRRLHSGTSSPYLVTKGVVLVMSFGLKTSFTRRARKTFGAVMASASAKAAAKTRSANTIGLGSGAGGAFGGRSRGRKRLFKGRGKRGQAFVSKGLNYLAKTQLSNGSWPTHSLEASRIEATAQVLLAFVGTGETTKSGKFKTLVAAGITWLINQQETNGSLGDSIKSHAMATAAIAEVYAISKDENLAAAYRLALSYLLSQRRENGGWGSAPLPVKGDSVATTWAVIAARSSKAGGTKIDDAVFKGAWLALDALTDPITGLTGFRSKGRRAAVPSGEPSVACTTAMASFARILCGAKRHDKTLGLAREFLAECAIDKIDHEGAEDLSFWQFGSLVAYQTGGDHYTKFNTKMDLAFLDHETKDGSWARSNGPAKKLGVPQSTAIALRCLEIYYLYGRVWR